MARAQRKHPRHRARGQVRPVSRERVALESAARQTIVPGSALLPLRLFLGITFIYAGIQKLTDPGFFTLGSPTYIGTQIHGFARGSPISSILLKLSEHAIAIGALTILTEMAVGLLVLLGLFTRPAALTGLLLSFTFFLSASWHTTPYFYGSDIVFVMCWVTLILTGPGGFAFDPVAAEWLRDKVPAYALSWITGPLTPSSQSAGEEAEEGATPAVARVTRGEILLGGAVAALLVYLGLVPRGRPQAGSVAPSSSSSAASAPSSSTSSSSGAPAGTKKVGNVSSLQPNSAIAITDPKTGDPAAIVKLTSGKIVCFDTVCTHAGCTVQYDPQYRVFVCPCHGGAFDPAQGGQVISGPPPAPIAQIPISIDSQGNAYIA